MMVVNVRLVGNTSPTHKKRMPQMHRVVMAAGTAEIPNPRR